MRLSVLLCAAAVAALLLATVSMATSLSEETAVLPPEPASLEEAQQGLKALKELADLFEAVTKIFDVIPGGQVAGLISKAIGFISTILGFFGSKGNANREHQQLLKEFVRIHNRLDRIDLKLERIIDLIKWKHAMSQYYRFEQNIQMCSRLFDKYANQDNEKIREIYRDEFQTHCRSTEYMKSAAKLYNGVMNTGVITTNIVKAVRQYSKEHQPFSISFLMHLSRVIMRGAEMEIVLTRMTVSEDAAKEKKRDWDRDVARMMARIEQADKDIRRQWLDQKNKDISDYVDLHYSRSRRDFARGLAKFLHEKYPYRHWLVVCVNQVRFLTDVASRLCGGVRLRRAKGDKKVLVASADPRRSQFNAARALSVQRSLDQRIRSYDAFPYYVELDKEFNTCSKAAAKIAIRAHLDAHFQSYGGRLVHVLANPSGSNRVHTITFG